MGAAVPDSMKVSGALGCHSGRCGLWDGRDGSTPGFDALERDMANCDVAVIDNSTLAFLGNPNALHEAGPFVMKLLGAARAAECAIILLHHAPRSGRHGYGGTTSWFQHPRAHWYWQLTDDTGWLIPNGNPRSRARSKKAAAWRLHNAKQNYAASGQSIWFKRGWAEARPGYTVATIEQCAVGEAVRSLNPNAHRG